MKKEILQIIIKVLIYALGLVGAYLGVSSLTSCSTAHSIDAYGRTVIVTSDTTVVKHTGYLNTKNYRVD